jgi:hypothetical protein
MKGTSCETGSCCKTCKDRDTCLSSESTFYKIIHNHIKKSKEQDEGQEV